MTSQTLAVIDYGMGNLHSVASALSHVAPEIEVQVTSEPEVIARADRVVFPGVGAIGECMKAVRKLGFDHLLRQQVAAGKPVLGVCVGMQRSEEHTSELQSRGHLVCRLLLEKKTNAATKTTTDRRQLLSPAA